MDNHIQVVVIGAGVIGCAVARELQNFGYQVIVLDKELRAGMGITSRNSEVIHAGIYYQPASLKATLCHRGRTLLYEYCATRKIAHRKIGKYIVATCPEELTALETIAAKAALNEVHLEPISPTVLRDREPAVAAVGALYSSESGIISAHEFTTALQREAEDSGAQFVFNTTVETLEQDSTGWSLTTYPTHKPDSSYTLFAEIVINCAGLHGDTIAGLAGIDCGAAHYTQHWVKGEYFSLATKWGRALHSLIYPVPENQLRGLGVHVTLDIAGQAKLGPNVIELERIEDYSVDPTHQQLFFEAAQKFLPALHYDDLSPAYSGIRPKLSAHGEAARDFMICDEGARGYQGFINLLGIESPGLTSALAIAEYVRRLLA